MLYLKSQMQHLNICFHDLKFRCYKELVATCMWIESLTITWEWAHSNVTRRYCWTSCGPHNMFLIWLRAKEMQVECSRRRNHVCTENDPTHRNAVEAIDMLHLSDGTRGQWVKFWSGSKQMDTHSAAIPVLSSSPPSYSGHWWGFMLRGWRRAWRQCSVETVSILQVDQLLCRQT